MTNVLVTGANGQLGKSIRVIAQNHHELNFVFTDVENLDITNQEFVLNFFKTNDFHFCINCAAYTAVDKAEEDIDSAFLINSESVKYLAEASKLNNVILIHISTDFVFDGEKTNPYTEDDMPNPINIYGESKLKAEQYVKTILKDFFIIRTSWVYSEFGHNFLKTMLRLGGEHKEISVVNDQYGSPTYARDLAEFLVRILKSKEDNYGIYHYSNEGEISWYNFAKEIFKISVLDAKVNPINTCNYPTPAVRPKNSKLSSKKTIEVFGSNMLDWKHSLNKCMHFLEGKF